MGGFEHEKRSKIRKIIFFTACLYIRLGQEGCDYGTACMVFRRPEDGNQALIEPMSLDEKLQFFEMLVEIGFKEIEVGFPAASETEYEFMRSLIERDMIPDDVTVQVLTQAREHIIKKTFEAVKGAPHAVIHLYNSTSVAQRERYSGKAKRRLRKLRQTARSF